MIQSALKNYFLLLFFLAKPTTCPCQNSYLNFCGSNYTEVEDFRNNVCDCQEVIFCSVVELLSSCNPITLHLSRNEHTTLLDQLQCDMSPLGSQLKTPNYVILNQTESQVIIEILSDLFFGKFKISCVFETSDEFVPSVADEWEVVDVYPTDVVVDSEIKLLVTVTEKNVNSPSTWCFVSTPDNNIEVLSTSWISVTQAECLGFNPMVPGFFRVSLSSIMPSNFIEKSGTIKVFSKHPIPQKAEYSIDFETILIHFDQNIDLHSSCNGVFPKETQEYFGTNFNCSAKGNILVIKMGSKFEFVDDLAIIPENKIFRAGSQGDEFCLPALPASLLVSKPKVVGPNLSLQIKSECSSNSTQKRLSIQVLPSKQPQLTVQNRTLQTKSHGKTQRKNLIFWRKMRQIQKKFSSRRITIPTNPAEMDSLFENISLLDNLMDAGNYNLDSSASVSVLVQSSPASSSILAEAIVSFCEHSVQLFRYKWFVNGKNAFQDGKLLTVKDLAPGKYIFECLIIDYISTQTLGQGLATTEILPGYDKIVIVPSEITVGATDDISLYAITDHRGSVSWACKTAVGGLCTTVDQKLVNEIIDLNSYSISIPAATLPFGEYIWTVESARGSNEAKVSIKPGNITIGVQIQSFFVESSQEVVLLGNVKQIQQECDAWWNPVRQKGFSYLHLRDVERNEKIFPGEKKIPLLISSEDWKNAEPDSSYMFKLQVLCPGGSLNHVKVPLRLSNPPQVTSLRVEPLSGKAMITVFIIFGVEASASVEDYPLVYEWSYVDSCDVEVQLKREAFSRNYTTYLPPGELKIFLKVCNGKNICSVKSSPTINVIQESEFPAENFQKSLSQIQYLTLSGDIVEGFGLAITVLKSLALLTETEIREKVFVIIEEVISIKMKDLTEKTQSDPNGVKLSLEFFERALKIAKYFRKGSDILIRLKEFKNKISKQMKKVNWDY